MDIVVSNWARTAMKKDGPRHPLRVYYGDWNEDGVMEAMEGYYEKELKKVVPWRGLNGAARGMPWIKERYATHAAYSEAGVEEILGERVKEAKVWEAVWLETTVFLNRGGRFEAVVLPGEAQYAPAFGVNVGDMDGDGKEDIFLSQNFFGVDEETTRYDAGRGVWLRGDGGSIRRVPGQVSGTVMGGGEALCDYDGDGRVDLVGQNAAETKLYQNIGAKPGQVRLVGPVGNPPGRQCAVGERGGPQVHAAWVSQDSAVQVLGTPDPPRRCGALARRQDNRLRFLQERKRSR
jgi:hypothetical protein